MPEPRKLLDRVGDALRIKHYSYRTEQTCIVWMKCYIIFHKEGNPKEMDRPELEAFLSYLAQEATQTLVGRDPNTLRSGSCSP